MTSASYFVWNSAPTIRGKSPRCTLLARYVQTYRFLRRSWAFSPDAQNLRRRRKIHRKIPATRNLPEWLRDVRWKDGDVTWNHVTLGFDFGDESVVAIEIDKRKTGNYNEWESKTPGGYPSRLCPVMMYARWSAMRKCTSPSNGKVSRPTIRARFATGLRTAGTVCGVGGSLIGAHSVRTWGASAMFAAGYDLVGIRRWGRRISNTAHQYLRKGEYMMSST